MEKLKTFFKKLGELRTNHRIVWEVALVLASFGSALLLSKCGAI